MIQFLQPIWLFALAGIAIPVIIHLWNEKEGKTLEVGSIRLLSSSSRQNARSLKLMDLLLLLLRCLLILLLSLLLAKPIWHKSVPPAEQKGWILMEKPGLHETYAHFKGLVDSLSKAGYEFHYFDEGFVQGNLEEILKGKEDTVSAKRAPYWMLLSALNRQVPAGLPVYLFTTNSLERFQGTRAEVSMNLKWLRFTPADSISTGPVKGYLTLADSIRLISAESRPSGYFFKSTDLSPADQRNAGQQVSFEAGRLTVSINAAQGRNTPGKIEVDTSTLRLVIYEDKTSLDGRYLRAVFEAFSQFSKRKIKVVQTENLREVTGNPDWLFWLSAAPVPKNDAKNIFRYENGKVTNVSSWLRPGDHGPFEEPVALHRLIRHDSLNATLATDLWQDGFGNAVLSSESVNGTNVYRFFSRFDPAWTDLPWSKEFPAMMLHLVEQGHSDTAPSVADQRIIDTAQSSPVIVQDHQTGSRKLVVHTDLSDGLWAAAFLLFALERVVSFTKKKEKRYG